MDLRPVVPFLLFVFILGPKAKSQSPAVEQKLNARFGPEQIMDMQANEHHKYAGLILFYSSSFLVSDGTTYHTPTELEIAAVDLHQFDAQRRVDESVVVFDTTTGLYLKLLGRNEFEQVVLAQLGPQDRAEYLRCKAAMLGDPALKHPTAR